MHFKDFLRYRQSWLGVALIWIMFFHMPFDFGLLQYPIAAGYGGVDICFFASGIGCFYSLSSNSDVLSFMKRRTQRLLPTYLIFIVFWLVFQYFFVYFAIIIFAKEKSNYTKQVIIGLLI